MGSNVTNGDLRGFLVPWPFSSSNLWGAQATYTEQTPKAGTPDPAGSYGLVINTAGSQSDQMTILSQKGGRAKRGEFVWKKAGDYYGRTPNTQTFWESVASPTIGGTAYYHPLDVFTDSTGRIFILAHYFGGVVPNVYGYRIFVRSTAGTWTNYPLYTQSSSTASLDLYGAICELEDNSIIVSHWLPNTAGTKAQIQTWRSTDGTTWTKISSQALDNALDIGSTFGAGNSGYEVQKTRMRSIDGQILLIAHLLGHNTTPSSTDLVGQWVSVDGGTSYQLVEISDGTFAASQPELLIVGGKFAIVYHESVDTTKMVLLPNPYTGIGTAKAFGSIYVKTLQSTVTVAGTLANKYFTQGQLACWEDSAGDLYAVMEEVGSNQRLFMMVSSDDGDTWKFMGGNTDSDDGQIFWLNTSGYGPTRIAGSYHGGGSVLVSNFDAINAGFENLLGCFYYGQWSTVTFPEISQFPTLTDFGWWKNTWVAVDFPHESSTITATGTGTNTTNPGYVLTSTTSGNERYWNYNYTGGATGEGVIVRVRLESGSNGLINRQERAIQISTTITSGGSTVEYRAVIQLSPSQIRIHDLHATADLATASVDSTQGIEIFVAMTGVVSCWYRIADNKEKTWTNLISNQSLTSDPSGTANYVRIGGIASPTSGTVTTKWMEWCVAHQTATGDQISAGQSNPDEIASLPYPPRGKYAYLADGLSITTRDGPAREGDSYVIDLAHEYPIEKVFYGTSPTTRTTWRSNSVVSGNVPENLIPLVWDPTILGTDDTKAGDLLGVHLSNINFQSFKIERYNPAGFWTVMATVENKVGPFSFLRDGSSFRSVGTGPYMFFNESSGWRVKLDDGAGNVVYRKIRNNSEGALSSSSNSQNAQFYLDDVQQTDPVAGTATLIPDSITVVVDFQGTTGSAIGIRITAQETREKYFQIGSLVAGRVMIPGKQYSRGRSIRYESGTSVTIQDDGIQRSRVLDPGGRKIKLAWTEGVDVSNLYDDPADPDYFQATTTGSGNPIATLNDVPDMLMGIIRYCEGAKTPMVYIPRLFPQASTLWTFNRGHQHAFVTLDSDIQIDHVVGDESTGGKTGEVFRVATIDLREIR